MSEYVEELAQDAIDHMGGVWAWKPSDVDEVVQFVATRVERDVRQRIAANIESFRDFVEPIKGTIGRCALDLAASIARNDDTVAGSVPVATPPGV